MFFIFFFHAFQLLAAIQKKKFKLVFHNKKIVKFILLQYLTPSLKFDTKKKKKKQTHLEKINFLKFEPSPHLRETFITNLRL